MSTKINHIVFLFFFLIANNSEIYCQSTTKKDSVQVNASELLVSKKLIKKDSAKKPLLEGIVNRKAKDYEKFDQRKKRLTLYNKAELYYKDFEIKSGIIVLDYEKNEIYAGRLKDSTGKYTQFPYFKQGENIIEPDSIRFNTKTKKALIWNTKSKQGELFLKSEISKRENDSVIFFNKARFTTSTNIENPEYYFLAYKAKLVPKKKFVTGVTHMYIANVPTPIGLPFAFFPMTTKNTSGVLVPVPGQNNTLGYSLQNGGYYFALSDKYDLALMGDYYTNGTYAMQAESNYASIYKFKGQLKARYENQVFGEKGFPGYQKTTNYNIQWNHSQDAKASANSRFSTSVNFGNSKYLRQSINYNNVGSNLINTMTSSISYNKTIPTIPSINFSVALNHYQNTNTHVVNLTLPTFNANIDRIFPFAKSDGVKNGFLENINFQYSLKGENKVVTTEEMMFKSEMFKDAASGLSHSIPVSTNFKMLKHFSVTSGVSFTENWLFNTFKKEYNTTTREIENIRVNGFDAYRTYNFYTNFGTTIYGMFIFKETGKIKAIRHLMKPNFSYTYTPSFEKYAQSFYYKNIGTIDNFGKFNSNLTNKLQNTYEKIYYSRFENTLYGGSFSGVSNRISFSLDNSIEAKVADKESKKEDATKKINLFNQLNFSTGYDLTAKEFNLEPIRFTLGTSLLDNKLGFNFGAQFDPYDLDSNYNRINEFSITNGNGLARMTMSNITLSYSVANTDFNSDKQTKITQQNGGRNDGLFGVPLNTNNPDSTEENTSSAPSEFYKYDFPWDLQIQYSLSYSNQKNENEITSNSVMFSGNVDLSTKWKLGLSSGYDFVQKGITSSQLRFERDLESWKMSFSIVPVGLYSSWNFFIGIKSSILSDIKWDKFKTPDPRLR